MNKNGGKGYFYSMGAKDKHKYGSSGKLPLPPMSWPRCFRTAYMAGWYNRGL